jgi:superfamily I DNA and RNA helicase
MPVDVVYGEARNRAVAQNLAAELQGTASEGTIYLGYPVLASADESVDVDALFVSPDHGLVAFLLGGGAPVDADQWSETVNSQDRLFAALDSHLGRHPELRRRRELRFPIQTVTVFPEAVTTSPADAEGYYVGIDQVRNLVNGMPAVPEDVFRAIQAAVQSVSSIKPAKRRASATRDGSRGAIMKIIEREIANLDRWQKRAAIETPEGPQRIRGLAGSGKTIVLALKAAYLHSQHEDWQIALTFQSRALYQQFQSLIRRFFFEYKNDEPDYDKLQVIHAWGSSVRSGVYTEIANAMGVIPRDFNYARATYGMDDAFAGVCRELLSLSNESSFEPVFDAVLLDEAQDLPPEFFQLVYRFTREPKRIIWAYDELQKLSEASMPDTVELFGSTSSGDPIVSLTEVPGEARKDVVLPVCYRNTPWSLATAHALGFGIYRARGLIQHFDEPSLWTEIGYATISGTLMEGHEVTLARSETSYPPYFPQLLNPSDAVVLRTFADELEQDSWVAEEITRNLANDELEPDDILVVLPDTYTSRRRGARLSRVLGTRGIASHLVGVNSSVDEVFIRDSVAIAHIYRAKGNEAPMVYVLDAQYGSNQLNQITRRNTIFTAITRSRAWVRICGWGPQIADIALEVQQVEAQEYRLNFTVPTAEQLRSMRRINRDRTREEAETLKRATRGLQTALDALERSDIDLDDLPPELRTRLITRLRENPDADF